MAAMKGLAVVARRAWTLLLCGFVLCAPIFTAYPSAGRVLAANRAAEDGSAFLSQFQVLDINGAPVVNMPVRVEAVPRSASLVEQWPIAGTGATDSNGMIQVTMNGVSINDLSLNRFGDIVNFEVFLIGPSGLPVPILGSPVYLGADPNRTAEFNTIMSAYNPVQLGAQSSALLGLPTQSTPIYDPGVGFIYDPGNNMPARVREEQAQQPVVAPTSLPPCPRGIDKWHRINDVAGLISADTVVGELHSSSWIDSAQFSFGPRADSTIEVAVSYKSRNGPFVNWGTNEISNTFGARQTIVVHNQDYNHRLTTLIKYEMQQQTCDGLTTHVYFVRPVSWPGTPLQDGDDLSADIPTASPNYTTMLAPATTFSTGPTAHKASTYENAVNIFGISLRATSGYSDAVEVMLRAGTQRGCIYGNNAPAEQSEVVYTENC